MTNDRQQAADDHTEQIARDLCEGVRQLNHATAGPPGLTCPGTVYTVLGATSPSPRTGSSRASGSSTASSARNSTPAGSGTTWGTARTQTSAGRRKRYSPPGR